MEFDTNIASCGFPFEVPHESVCPDEDGVRYMYVRRHDEDKNVVPYNPEIARCSSQCT